VTVAVTTRKPNAGAHATAIEFQHNGPGTDFNRHLPAPATAPDFRGTSEPITIRNFAQSERRSERGTEIVAVPKPLNELVDDILAATGGWPRRVGTTIFVDEAVGGIRWFDRNPVAGLFAWLRSRFSVEWRKGGDFVSSAELLSQLTFIARKYAAVELLPHEPPIGDVYYRCDSPTSGDGAYLDALLNRFRPATQIDRYLIKAAIMSVFWGGPPGQRPVFVITSDDGRGVGKSKCADLIAYLGGGALGVDAGCDISVLKERLLSPEGATKRVAVLDNVKSLRFSWAELEGLVTADTISGKKMYVGEEQRPNYLTWLLTLNGVALGDDMAQRAVVIKVVRGTNSGTWYEDTRRFVDDHRQQIISDVIGALRSDRNPLTRFSRWAAWEHDVMARLPSPDAIQKLIVDRQNESNCELDEAEILEEFFAEQLRMRGCDPETATVHISSALACEWYGAAMGEKVKTAAASKRLMQLSSEKRNQTDEAKLNRIKPNPCRKFGRGFLWLGQHAGPNDRVDYRLTVRRAEWHPQRNSSAA
jgi:hypothetical protein